MNCLNYGLHNDTVLAFQLVGWIEERVPTILILYWVLICLTQSIHYIIICYQVNKIMLKADVEKYLQYFDRSVLSHYRVNSHAYKIIEDDIGGELRIADGWDESIEDKFPYLELHFGFRKLKDNTTCIAMFMPTFADKVPETEITKWIGFHIKNPEFQDIDENFNRWVQRYIYGSWDVESGPKIQIERILPLISSLTNYAIGIPLFKYEKNLLLNYPHAENTEEYIKANLEMYRLIVDGMQKNAIVKIAEYLTIPLGDPNKTLNSLKQILPIDKHNLIHKPLKKLSQERSKIHGLPENGIKKLGAFSKFDEDLKSILSCLVNLMNWLEDIFNLDAESCKRRYDSLTSFPKIVGLPRPEFKYAEIQKCVGKTIKAIEFGEEKEYEDVHQREGIIIHFTDNSSMSISIDSNAYNLYCDKKINPTDFHTYLMIFWADAIKVKK